MLTRKEAEEIKYQLHDLADMYIRVSESTTPCMQFQAQIRASNLYATYQTIKHLSSSTFNSDIIPVILTDGLINRAHIDANKLFTEAKIDCTACDKFNGCRLNQKYDFLGMDRQSPAEVTHV